MSVSVLSPSLSLSSICKSLSLSPRRLWDSATPSLSSMVHLVEESLFEAIIWRLSRWNRRLRLSPRRLRVSLCLLDDSASLLFSSVTLRLCDSLALLDGSPRRRISLRGNHPASVKVESTTPSISLSPRGFRLSLIQLGDSATL